MCGYLFHNFKPDEEIPKELLNHRGPDNYTVHSVNNRYFHHWRLSILDLSDTANQPIESHCGTHRMIYNGEIYNYNDLRNYLEKTYHQEFKTTGDTEVLFYGLINEGAHFVKKLNGMFSFLFYDKSADNVLMARDFFGIKPIYYFMEDNKLIVSSEIGPIQHLSARARGFNKEVQCELLNYGYVYGDKTLYEGVSKLEPGSILRINLGDNSIEELKKFSPALTAKKSFKVEEALATSVRGQIISDVPIGVLNSGGIDSGLVTYLVGQYYNKNRRAESYTAVFTDTPNIDESSFAKKVAESSGLNSTQVDINSQELGKRLKELILFNREVLLHPNAFNIYLLGKEASKRVKVLLSGEGSDELLQGYKFFRIIPLLKYGLFRAFISKKRNHPYKNFKFSYNGDNIYRSKYLYTSVECVDWFSRKYPKMSTSLMSRNSLFNDIFEKFGISKEAFVELERHLYLPPLLDRQDRMLMASSIEGRVPFLDNNMLQYLHTKKDSEFSSLFKSKIPLTNLYYEVFGSRRKKFAFATPLKDYVKALKGEIDFNVRMAQYSKEVGISQKDLLSLYKTGDDQVKWILLNLLVLCPQGSD
jgi:asparagine synthase (glutamine-hydrolysing)